MTQSDGQAGTGGGTSPDCAPASAARRTIRSRWRGLPRKWRVAIIAVAGTFVGLVALTHGPVPKAIARAMIRAQTGARLDASWVRLGIDGTLHISSPTLTIDDRPDIPAEARRVFAAEKIEASLSFSRFFTSVRPTHVVVRKPVLLLSESAAGKGLNVLALKPAPDAAAGMSLPTVDIQDARLVIAEHDLPDAGGMRTLTEIPLRASISGGDGGTAGAQTVSIEQTGGEPLGIDGTMFSAAGTLNPGDRTGSIVSTSLDLTRLSAEKIPGVVRDAWRSLNIAGKIDSTRIDLLTTGVRTTLRLADVAVTLPIPPEADLPDTGAKSARMTNVQGEIVLSREGVRARMDADLLDLRVNVDFAAATLAANSAYTCTLTASNFRLERQPRLLGYLPKSLLRLRDAFGSPSAEVDAKISIDRAAPAAAGAIPAPTIAGSLAIRGGTARFREFPYPITDISGSVRFDADRMDFLDVAGIGPSGAKMLLNGWVSPLNMHSGMSVGVTLLDVPVDDHLRSAVRSSRGSGMLDLIFNDPQAQRLHDQSLVITRNARDAARVQLTQTLERIGNDETRADEPTKARIAQLRATLEKPAFALGGLIDRIDLRVDCDAGADTAYRTNINVAFAEVSLVPAIFAYPVVASNMKLQVTDTEAILTAADLRGLSGARAEFVAKIPLLTPGAAPSGAPAAAPRMRLKAFNVPVDDLLIHALPRAGQWSTLLSGDFVGPVYEPPADEQNDAAGSDPTRIDPRRVLSALRLDGRVDCEAVIGPLDDAATKADDFDVKVTFANMSARPAPVGGAEAACVTDLRGTLDITPTGVKLIGLAGAMRPAGELDPDLVGPLPVHEDFTLDAHATFASDGTTGIAASMNVHELDVSLGVESLVNAIAPALAAQIADARPSVQPTGKVSASLTLSGSLGPNSPLRIEARTTSAQMLGATMLDGRLEIDQADGVLSASIDMTGQTPTRLAVSADEAVLSLWFEDRRAGVLQIDGAASVALDGGSFASLFSRPDWIGRAAVDRAVNAELSGITIQTPLVRALVRTLGPEWLPATMRRHRVRGEFDATAVLTALGAKPDYRARIRPRSLRFDASGSGGAVTGAAGEASSPRTRPNAEEIVDVPLIAGEITVTPTGGDVDTLVLNAERWDLRIDGTLARREKSLGVDLVFQGDAGRLDPMFLALLPRSVRDALTASRVLVSGGLDSRGAKLSMDIPYSGAAVSTSFSGPLRIREVSADVGFSIRNASGTLDLSVESLPGRSNPVVTLSLRDGTLVASRISLVRGTGLAVVNPPGADGRIELHSLRGVTSGGAVELKGGVLPPEAGTLAEERRYFATLDLQGVRFADLLRDMRANAQIDGGDAAFIPAPASETDLPRRSPDADPSRPWGLPMRIPTTLANTPHYAGDTARGALYVSMRLDGVVGDAARRTGSGEARIVGGDVVRVPLVVPIIKLTSLQLPIDERLDYLQAGFTLKGNMVRFHEIGLMGEAAAIWGHGDVTLPRFDLDLRFATTSEGGIPIIGDLLSGLRNRIVTTTVKGSIDDPQIGTSLFSGTPNFFRAAGAGPDDPVPDGLNETTQERLRAERVRALEAARQATNAAP